MFFLSSYIIILEKEIFLENTINLVSASENFLITLIKKYINIEKNVDQYYTI